MARLVKDDEDLFGGKPKEPDAPTPKGRGPTGAASSSTSSGKRPAWATKLEADLTELFTEYGTDASLILPLTSYVFVAHAGRRAHRWVLLAERSPKVRAALERMVQGSALTIIVTDALTVAVAAGVEFGRLAPDSGPARRFGVTQAAIDLGYRMTKEEEALGGAEEIMPEPGPGAAGGLLAELATAS